MTIPIIGESEVLKPNARVMDTNNGLIIERYMGNMSFGIVTPKGIARFTYANAAALRRMLLAIEDMLDKIDDREESNVPSILEERLKTLAARTGANVSVHIDPIMDGEVVRREFAVTILTQAHDETTPHFRFLAQAILNAENMVASWDKPSESPKPNSDDESGPKERPTV